MYKRGRVGEKQKTREKKNKTFIGLRGGRETSGADGRGERVWRRDGANTRDNIGVTECDL